MAGGAPAPAGADGPDPPDDPVPEVPADGAPTPPSFAATAEWIATLQANPVQPLPYLETNLQPIPTLPVPPSGPPPPSFASAALTPPAVWSGAVNFNTPSVTWNDLPAGMQGVEWTTAVNDKYPRYQGLLDGTHLLHDPVTHVDHLKSSQAQPLRLAMRCFTSSFNQARTGREDDWIVLRRGTPEVMRLVSAPVPIGCLEYYPLKSVAGLDTSSMGYTQLVVKKIPSASNVIYMQVPGQYMTHADADTPQHHRYVRPPVSYADPFGLNFRTMAFHGGDIDDESPDHPVGPEARDGPKMRCICETCSDPRVLQPSMKPSGMYNGSITFDGLDVPLWLVRAMVLYFSDPLVSLATGGAIMALERGTRKNNLHLQFVRSAFQQVGDATDIFPSPVRQFFDTEGRVPGKDDVGSTEKTCKKLADNIKRFLFPGSSSRKHPKRALPEKFNLQLKNIIQSPDLLHNWHGGSELRAARRPAGD